MTREEALPILDDMYKYYNDCPNYNKYVGFDKYDNEAFIMAYNALKQESYEDTINRQAAIDAVKKNTFRLTFAEEQGYEGHVAWSAEAVYSDVIKGALLELPPVALQPKMGKWIKHDTGHSVYYNCSLCSCCALYTETADKILWKLSNFCPDCGAKMQEKVEE